MTIFNGIVEWTLEQVNQMILTEYKDKPDDYVSSELTPFVKRFIKDVKFFRISPKKTVCLLTFKNGFDVIGYSGCVNPNHFRYDIGSKYALHTAVDKASEIIAYQEQNSLFNCPGTETYDIPA